MIIFDLDGTLADCEHRRHFVINPYAINGKSPECSCGDSTDYSCPFDDYCQWKPDWKAFYEACDQDNPIEPVIMSCMSLFRCLDKKDIKIWSGRCESVRQKTLKWLWINQVVPAYVFGGDFLKMRPFGDSTPDDQLKERWLDEALAEGKSVDYVFDDRPKVIRMWRRRGIFVFNCCQHEREF